MTNTQINNIEYFKYTIYAAFAFVMVLGMYLVGEDVACILLFVSIVADYICRLFPNKIKSTNFSREVFFDGLIISLLMGVASIFYGWSALFPVLLAAVGLYNWLFQVEKE